MMARLSTPIELSICCKNLRDKDTFSKSDPMVVVRLKSGDSSYFEIGRTERIENNLNPEFAKRIPLDYKFEEFQQLKFEVYDIDSKSQSLDAHDFLGSLEASVGQIVSASTGVFVRPLTGSGTILIRSFSVQPCREALVLTFAGRKLEKKDFFGKSDPFLTVSKFVNGSWVVVHRTEFIKKTLEPIWQEMRIPLRDLTDNIPPASEDSQVRLQCFDWDSDGSHDLIGECFPVVAQLRTASTTLELVNPLKKNDKKSRGQIIVKSSRSEELFSFIDYISSGGTCLNFLVAIDFTGSNGDPRDSSSLHFHRPPERPSVYAQAIHAVGRIIQEYDNDRFFPVYGFGATLPSHIARGTQHDFHVSLTQDPNCHGVEGILAAYSNCLPQVELSGPTNFTPVINMAINSVSSQPVMGGNYSVLLILTDGLITDMPATRNAIVTASMMPMSIIIVGVGNADFSAMNELDSDGGPLTDMSGRPAERDIVQFVQFSKFKNPDSLAAAVLAELPGQLVDWMRKHNVRPKTQL